MVETNSSNIDPLAYKQIMAHWASGVTIVTTWNDGVPHGMTVSSFASVSLNPSRVLVCLSRTSNTHDALLVSRTFAVNLLSREQLELGKRFAGLVAGSDGRFQDIKWRTACTGAPILPGVLGWLDCRVVQTVVSGDHTIVVGEVEDGEALDLAEPLLYHNRSWRHLAHEALTAAP
jgi:flavin reductase (DIM6/NTAB) family NADH-FMN oxidoreductase RutF